ncbi:allophanate hydrolase subunit 1 [Mycolicibacillus parakoreensis]|uniref:Allophanate hydrolase subunit 1 n=1 Tax=Mycolicibacillus parakoreensis TaxID=1069221 RepID=A0ABY3U1Q6_9MYCO|nr:allophanate hydrolase subunit 1 [Mycolicibacillus parakoreensis]MCV7316370.1 allophanate hydrolase subunit 1 [Mycolicibacillus parakoreensis]ULN52611.1 allophanate hydrolase subunit 1 [Mycolicibacillus parakoreensis]HLR99686.1 allophanate hydrolase subunit 1 [Mycolicibacillus parakoreensis]
MSVALDLTVPETILDYGDRALLLQCAGTAEVLAWTEAVRKAALPGVHDVVPASRTVLVKLEDPTLQGVTRQRLRTLRVVPEDIQTAPPADGADVTIDVVYDGPDLAVVSEHTGLSVAQIIAAHTAAPWRVGFGGATPGFAYLTGGDPRLAIPRRADTRESVPAGSVALAGEFSGIYPRTGPGWWQLIGRTDTVVWDIDRPNPALLTPGMWVQFQPV